MFSKIFRVLVPISGTKHTMTLCFTLEAEGCQLCGSPFSKDDTQALEAAISRVSRRPVGISTSTPEEAWGQALQRELEHEGLDRLFGGHKVSRVEAL